VDPVQRVQVAALPYTLPGGDFTIDPDAGVVYLSGGNGYERHFWALDANKFIPLAFTDENASPSFQWIKRRLVRCGSGGLAGINEYGHLALVPLNLLKPLDPVTSAVPVSGSQGVVRVAVPNQSLAYSPVLNKLYVSVPDYVPGLGNSILQLDPNTLVASGSQWVGSRPSTMAVTQDGLHLYQQLDGSNLLRRIDLKAFAPDLDTLLYGTEGYPAGIYGSILSIVPLPQSPDSIVVVRGDAAAVYDRGSQRPNVVANGPSAVVAAIDDKGSTLFRLSVDTTSPKFDRLSITPQGLFPLPGSLAPTNDSLYFVDMKCASDTCVVGTGIVIDAVNNKVLGTCPIDAAYGSPSLDLADRQVYFLVAEDKDVRILGCSLDTFSLTSQLILAARPQFSGDLLLIQDRFVFNTGNEVILAPKQALGLPPPKISAVVNAGSYASDGFAPLSIVTIFGSNFASGIAQATSFPLSTSLNGVSVSSEGYACFPLYVSPNQINLVLSNSLVGNAILQVSVGPASTTALVFVRPTAPGIFATNGNHAVAQNQDYTTNSPSSPAASGSVVTVYFTGQGATHVFLADGLPAPPDPAWDATAAVTTATIGGQPAAVLYSGATAGFSGVAQANIQVPNLPPGDYPVILTVGGAASNAASISVK
jgi:uncharacterized protein (TIGR03437 family)